jgi:hypothetical protein
MLSLLSFLFPSSDDAEKQENKEGGFEIYGQFKKFNEFVIGEKYEFQSQKTKCCIKKYEKNNQFHIWHFKSLSGFGDASTSGLYFSGVWIIDDDGLHPK